MAPIQSSEQIFDPVEALVDTLEHAWQELCDAYDVSSCLPDLQTLFAEADLSCPEHAAGAVVTAMLLEVTECVGRFSPWYKMPARAFGLVSVQNSKTRRNRWILAPEAQQRWETLLEPITDIVSKYSGLIQAMVLVDDLMQDIPGDPCITARCQCSPPHNIQIRKSVLEKAEILCHQCMQAYVSTEI
jgi:hypothetical protein